MWMLRTTERQREDQERRIMSWYDLVIDLTGETAVEERGNGIVDMPYVLPLANVATKSTHLLRVRGSGE